MRGNTFPTYLTADTVFEECTFGHSWENVNHRIDTILLVLLHVLEHLQAELDKVTVEEFIHEEHLTWRRKHILLYPIDGS